MSAFLEFWTLRADFRCNLLRRRPNDFDNVVGLHDRPNDLTCFDGWCCAFVRHGASICVFDRGLVRLELSHLKPVRMKRRSVQFVQ